MCCNILKHKELAPVGEALSIGIVVLGITYLSLVIGELVPKRLALKNAEKVASAVSRPMQTLSVIFAPIVHLLSISTESVPRLSGGGLSSSLPVAEEEVRLMMEEGTAAGVFEKAEQDIAERVLRLDNRRVSTLMTHRQDIIWLDLDDPMEETMCKITESVHSHFPVARGGVDTILGMVYVKDLLVCDLTEEPALADAIGPVDLKAILRPPLFLPESMLALRV